MDLQKSSGLPLKYDKGRIVAKNSSVFVPKADIRMLKDARPFLMNAEGEDRPLYYMYRDIHLKKDTQLLRKHRLRYDITVVLPGLNGKEFNRTIGHMHRCVPNTDVTYTEVYEVINGEALFFFQKMKGEEVKGAIVYHTKKNDKVIVPPGYAHITINPAKSVLIMSNWMCTDSKSDYGVMKKRHGGVYYCVKEKNKRVFMKNDNYKSQPEMVMNTPVDHKEFNLSKKKSMYASCIESPEKFGFLVHPERYDWEKY